MLETRRKHQPPKETLNTAQIELYKYLKTKYDMNGKVERSEILELYATFVKSEGKHYEDIRNWDEQKIWARAQAWVDRCIAVFARRGYVGLFFKVDLDIIDQYKGSLMGNRRSKIKEDIYDT